jgi:hypothetical protein
VKKRTSLSVRGPLPLFLLALHEVRKGYHPLSCMNEWVRVVSPKLSPTTKNKESLLKSVVEGREHIK